ncbi:phosphate acyltransferase PlsX [Limosilactobacillus secaliphilus]|uniref:Phosphate acyltransferase n=1 Tax=Limosilactobacillus secaliphilus TaxID=396268 RepID=A0A0R2IAD9_9LACO|nr:phosphate acyltransferase PlsX [Limosilactobacillus secaliphilus]KRN59095.1 fatty acid phospholipid synthesis protein PlsX [Limosilactobacillus secaliphilus]
MKIAVDAMGGDNAPQAIVQGVEQARDRFKDIEFLLYGDPEQVKPLVHNDERISLVKTTETISMGEEPVRAIRHKKDSSIVRAAMAVKKGEADAFFSAGNTGAVLAAGIFIVGRIKGIDRPGLTSVLPITQPGSKRHGFVYLDSGANAESKEKNLLQFAHLGRFYAENVLGVDHPRVALLNNGAEADKGDTLHKEVHAQLAQQKDLNFVGNVESGDLLFGKADVVVSDGWTANAALKATEGTAKMFLTLIKDGIMNGGLRAKLGYLLLKPVFHHIGHLMSTSTYGGAVLLGLNAPVVKTHGASDAKAVDKTIEQIHEMINSHVIEKTVAYFKPKNVDNDQKN